MGKLTNKSAYLIGSKISPALSSKARQRYSKLLSKRGSRSSYTKSLNSIGVTPTLNNINRLEMGMRALRLLSTDRLEEIINDNSDVKKESD